MVVRIPPSPLSPPLSCLSTTPVPSPLNPSLPFYFLRFQRLPRTTGINPSQLVGADLPLLY